MDIWYSTSVEAVVGMFQVTVSLDGGVCHSALIITPL